MSILRIIDIYSNYWKSKNEMNFVFYIEKWLQKNATNKQF